MFRTEFQGGPSVEVFSAQGSNPAANWKLAGAPAIKRVFAADVKSHVYNVEGGTAVKMLLPKDESKATLGLTQRFMVLQVFVPPGQLFAVELGVSDLAGSKRRLFLSTAHGEVTVTPLHARIPLSPIRRGVWMNLAIDVASLVADAFRGQTYRAVESIVVAANCRLRKIFTMKNQPPDDDFPEGGPSTAPVEAVPRQYALHADVQVATLVLTMPRIQAACAKGGESAAQKGAAASPDHGRTPTEEAPALSSASQGAVGAARKPLKGPSAGARGSAGREPTADDRAQSEKSAQSQSAVAQQRSSRLAQARARSRESLANAAANRSTSATSSNGDLQEIPIPEGTTVAASDRPSSGSAKRPSSARRLSDGGKGARRPSSPSRAGASADDGPRPSASVTGSRTGGVAGTRRSVGSDRGSQRSSGDSGKSGGSRGSGAGGLGAAVSKGAGPDDERAATGMYLYASHPHAPPPRNISPSSLVASEGRARQPTASLEDGVSLRRDIDDNDFSAGSGDEVMTSRDSGISVAAPTSAVPRAKAKTPSLRDARVMVDSSCSPMPSRAQGGAAVGAAGASGPKKYDAFRYQAHPNPALRSASGPGFPQGRSASRQNSNGKSGSNSRSGSRASLAPTAAQATEGGGEDEYDSDGGLRASFFAASTASSVASSVALPGSRSGLGHALLAGHLPRAGRLAPGGKSRVSATESRISHRSSRTNLSDDEDGAEGRATPRFDDESGHFFANSPLVSLNDADEDGWPNRRHNMGTGPNDGDAEEGDGEGRGDGTFSPPVVPPSARLQSQHSVYADEDENQRSLGHSGKLSNFGGGDGDGSSEEELDLLYDPMLNCYYDPRTNKYYELA